MLLGPVEPDLDSTTAPPALPTAASVTEFVTAAADTAREHAALSAASVVDVMSLEQLYAEVRWLARAYAGPGTELLDGFFERHLVETLLLCAWEYGKLTNSVPTIVDLFEHLEVALQQARDAFAAECAERRGVALALGGAVAPVADVR